MKIYITFGQDHYHTINRVRFDKDSVAVIEAEDERAGRARAVELFKLKWCTSYTENRWDHNHNRFFPRGFIDVPNDNIGDTAQRCEPNGSVQKRRTGQCKSSR